MFYNKIKLSLLVILCIFIVFSILFVLSFQRISNGDIWAERTKRHVEMKDIYLAINTYVAESSNMNNVELSKFIDNSKYKKSYTISQDFIKWKASLLSEKENKYNNDIAISYEDYDFIEVIKFSGGYARIKK